LLQHLTYLIFLVRFDMLIFTVILYFILVIVITWLVFVPESRAHSLGFIRSTRLKISHFVRALWPVRQARVAGSNARQAYFGLHFSWRTHSKYLIAAGLVLLVPIVVATFFRNHIQLEGYSDYEAEKDPVIVALLEGEQLIPPAPLPPEVFTTVEIQAERPMIKSASRDWQLLEANFRQLLLRAYKIMEEEHGYTMVLIEGYRTPERQNILAAMGPHVTRARAFQSYHQHGRAADSGFMRNGKIVISERDPWAMKGYQQFGEVTESVGLTWGGRWKLMDLGHVELRRGKK